MIYPTQVMVEKALNINPYTREYSTFSKIMTVTNEDLIDSYQTIGINEKKLLVPASSGDQFLTAKVLGAGKVIIYDINLFTKFFTFLKISACKYFQCYEDFKQFIIPQADNGKFLNLEDFMKVADYLPIEDAEFWYQYLKKCNNPQLYNLIPIIKLRHLKAIQHFTPYYSEEGFEKAKNIFDCLEYPKFLFCDLKKLPNKFQNTDQKFDLVDCSNIIECEIYKNFKSLLPPYNTEEKLQEKWIKFIQQNLATIVDTEGKIIVDYRLKLPQGSLSENDLLLNHDDFTTYFINSNYPEEKSVVVVYQKK